MSAKRVREELLGFHIVNINPADSQVKDNIDITEELKISTNIRKRTKV